MPTDHRAELANIKSFVQLIAYLRDEMGWPIARDSFEDVDDLFYDFTADELGIDPKTAAKITEIKRLKPLSTRQPWGIFFVKFEPKKLPVVALRRILSQVALKKRASANSADRTAWAADDLLFVSNYGEGSERQISFAHFAKPKDGHDLPTLKVLGWDNRDTALHLDAVAKELTQHLAWPDDDGDVEAWRKGWRGAFTLRHGEVVTTSKELSIRLAKLAGDIRDRIKSALAIETDRGPLTKLMKAFQTSLVHDLDADGFADMYAQTIAYGLLSARIADPHKKTVDDFAGHMRTNPFLRELMETFLKVGGRRGKAGGPGIDFDELGVSEVVELLDEANMEAVVRDFGDQNPLEDPVIHFYEHFLAAYDKEQKISRGVFYTPRPVVSYIVRSVDELLRTEFGLKDGLADTTTWGEMAERHKELKIPEGVSRDQAFVQILDPATGTGTFLVEVIDLIHRTTTEQWKAQGHGDKEIQALWNQYVPEHLLPRLHGYELLMAPYAVAHLKIGLKLYETGYRFGSDERVRVYLTNALEPASDRQLTLDFLPALAHEAQAVNDVKEKQRFTVAIGNPPYSVISVNTGEWIQDLLIDFRRLDGLPLRERNSQSLQDDYVKFTRLVLYQIEEAGAGLIGFITPHGFLDNPTFRGMRKYLKDQLTSLHFLDLHGNAYKKERAPDGSKDENVFDIQQGTAISILSKFRKPAEAIDYAECWGSRSGEKYPLLVSHTSSTVPTSKVSPQPSLYLFIPRDYALYEIFACWPSITELMPVRNNGLMTSRDDFVFGFTKQELMRRLRDFADSPVDYGRHRYGLRDVREMTLKESHDALRRLPDLESLIQPCLYRPMDIRPLFYHECLVRWPVASLMNEMLVRKNIGIVTSRMTKGEEFAHVMATRVPVEKISLSSKTSNNAYLFPLILGGDGRAGDLLVGEGDKLRPNLSRQHLERWIQRMRPPAAEGNEIEWIEGSRAIFDYIFAVLHSPGYRRTYAQFLKTEFPRIPLTSFPAVFDALACFGRELVALHLMESAKLNDFMTTYTGPKNPEVGRVGWLDNTIWLDAAATKKGQPATPGAIGFRGVPKAVWNFHIGGYQVCHKWLKDRKGRTLSDEDIAHYQKIIVALNETIRIMGEIDEVIEQHGGWPGAFQTADAEASDGAARKVAESPDEYGSSGGKS